MFTKTPKPQSRIDSLIGATTRIEGNVFFSGGLRVDGAVRGNVAALPDQPGTLVVSEQARIDGEVAASHIVVNGTINGPVHAAETLELQVGSRVKGDVHYKSLEIQQGALYPALYRLEHQGVIQSEWGRSENNRRAKFYRLTTDGRVRFREEKAGWTRLSDAIAMALEAQPQVG